ncbi:hypothetical protein JXM83_02575 [Candidatus Woesearchaeota archaeon]|nr:hypothetical protein [Candidatus Woesearchaeota archaeon]
MYTKEKVLATLMLVFLVMFSTGVLANANVLNVTISEAVSERFAYNPDMGEYSTGNATWNWTYVLQSTTMSGIINITNVGSEDLSDLNITFNGTDFLTAWPVEFSSPSYVNPFETLAAFVAGDPWWVYMTTLKAGDTVIYNYTMTLSADEPVNVTESYSVARIIEGGSFDIDISIRNSLTNPVNVSNVRIVKTPGQYYDQAGNPTYFNYTGIAGPDVGNAQLLPYDSVYRQLQWNVTALGNISPYYLDNNAVYNLTLTAQAPTGLNGTFPTLSGGWDNTTWGAYMLIGEMLINMTMEGSMSMFEIQSVEGVSTAQLEARKERLNETHWNTSVYFNNTASTVDYNLTRITIWSTNFTAGAFDPETNVIAGSTNTVSPNTQIANGTGVVGASQSFAWDWVPIVWADATYKVLDDGTQIQKIVETRTIDNGYWYIEEIYVLKGGYLIKVSKEIEPLAGQNAYNVTVLLENLGTEKTPDWVSMFDLIPPNFELLDASDPTTTFGDRDMAGAGNRYNDAGVTLRGVTGFAAIVGGTYDSYRGYRVDFQEIMNGSNGDSNFDVGGAEVRFQYLINGTGDLSRVGNAFLVGVDPQRTDGSVSSVEAPNTGIVMDIVNGVKEQAVTIVSLIVAVSALVAGLVLRKR